MYRVKHTGNDSDTIDIDTLELNWCECIPKSSPPYKFEGFTDVCTCYWTEYKSRLIKNGAERVFDNITGEVIAFSGIVLELI